MGGSGHARTPSLLAATAATVLSLSKRSLSRLISAGTIIARKDKGRTLVDAASVRAHYESLPKIEGPNPLACSIRAPAPRPRRKKG
jgi:hypothetical protein